MALTSFGYGGLSPLNHDISLPPVLLPVTKPFLDIHPLKSPARGKSGSQR